MQQQYRDQVDWEQAFPPEEYQERITKVRSELARQGLDGIYINIGARQQHPSGYRLRKKGAQKELEQCATFRSKLVMAR